MSIVIYGIFFIYMYISTSVILDGKERRKSNGNDDDHDDDGGWLRCKYGNAMCYYLSVAMTMRFIIVIIAAIIIFYYE